MNLLQTILTRPSLQTFKTRDFLPYLDVSNGNNHITTMDLQLTAQEVSKHDSNLNWLMQKSETLEVLLISIPRNCKLPSYVRNDPFSPLLNPICSTLKKLIFGYACDLTNLRNGGAWPGFLDMTPCVVLTDV